MADYFKLNGSIIYDVVDGETVVLQMESGRFYHFTAATKQFLDFFQSGAALDDFARAAHVAEPNRDELESAFQHLVRAKVLVPSETGHAPASASLGENGAIPSFLREGQKKFEDLVHLTIALGGSGH
jgi:hypothetical protein